MNKTEAVETTAKTQHKVAAFTVFIYTASAAILFSIYHLIISPILVILDKSELSFARGAIFEELFKFFFIYFFARAFSTFQQAATVGIAVGFAETVINYSVTFNLMVNEFSEDSDLSEMQTYIAISLGVFIKLLLSVIGHFATVYIALRVAKGVYLSAFFIAVVMHSLINYLVA